MGKPIRAVLIGAGQRGADVYGEYALQHPDEINFVAVAEPDNGRRVKFSKLHNINTSNQFRSWEQLLEKPQLGQAAFVCTLDHLHTAPAVAAMSAGYDILLEKPMAPTLDECYLLATTAAKTNRQLHVSHVLRHSPHFQKMKEIIDSGILGETINVSHRENVSWWHMAHSYVRGNWRNEAISAPMILTKCCHDFDILTWLLNDRSVLLSSVGNLIHFRPEKAPIGAAKRCLDGCKVVDTCRYYAPYIYVEHTPLFQGIADTAFGFEKWATKTYLVNPGLVRFFSNFIPVLKQLTEYRGWPSSTLTLDPNPESIWNSLEKGPYGRCVYFCDNDVVDHQVVLMVFTKGTSVTLTMHGHSHLEGRSTRIEGSNATLISEFSFAGSWIEINEHRGGRQFTYNTSASIQEGHGGGDYGLMTGFLSALNGRGGETVLTSAQTALESHLMAFAAEDARITGKTVRIEDYRFV